MYKKNHSVLTALLVLSFTFSPFSVATAKTPDKHVSKVSPMKLSAKIIEKAKKQLYYLLDKSYKKGEDELKKTDLMMPYAAVIKPDGEVKTISIGDSKMPAAFALRVLHDSLHALALKGKIAASAIYYIVVDPKIKKKGVRLLTIELEHSVGVGFVRVTPFKVVNHKISYSKGKEERMKKLIVMLKPKIANKLAKKEKAIKQ